jgi:hypothetical protein
MADPTVASWTPINIFAMMRAMVNNNVPFLTNAGAPTNGTSGTFVNLAGPGAILVDYSNANIYVNTNTLASPTWTRIGGASGAVLASPVLSGSVTGTYTLAGTPTIVSPTINTLKSNVSVSQVTGGYATDTYLAGSNISIPTGGYIVGTRYRCKFDLVKTAAGTAALAIALRIGTAASIADTAICTFTFGAGTAAVDSGYINVDAHFRTVGAATAAVVVGECTIAHALAATGITTTGASGFAQLNVVSSGFDSTVAATSVGLSVNGGTSFSGTNNIVQAELVSY